MGRRVGRHGAAGATQGVKRDSLKVGDEVVIIARPSRVPGEYRVLMVNLIRPSDGFAWGRRPRSSKVGPSRRFAEAEHEAISRCASGLCARSDGCSAAA